MASPFPFRRVARETVVAGVDLGATAVRVSAVSRAGPSERLIALAHDRLPRGAVERGLVRDPGAVGERLRKVLGAAEAAGGRRLDEIVIAVAGDDLRTRREVVRQARPPEAPVSVVEVDRAIGAAVRGATRAALATFADEPGLRRIPLRDLGAVVAAVGLDGRGFAGVRGQRGSTLEAAAVAAVQPVAQVSSAAAAAAGSGKRIRFVGAPLALASLLARASVVDAVVVDGGAELTGVAVLRGGSVIGARSFSVGQRSLERPGGDRETDLTTWARCVALAARDAADLPLPALVVLAGGLASAAGTWEALADAFGSEARIVEADRSAIGAVLGGAAPDAQYLVALGAATVDLR